MPADTPVKLATAYGGGAITVNQDGTFDAGDPYDGEFNNSLSKIAVGGDNNFSGAPLQTLLIRNIRRYDLDYTAAHAKIDELMLNTFSWLGADDTRYSPSVARFRDADGTISTTSWAFKDADGTDYTVN
jgi:hypothetical protein